jgi:hypothetical protein
VICICGDVFADHHHGVCRNPSCMTGTAGTDHCVAFQTALFRSPKDAHEFWITRHRATETAYIDKISGGFFILLDEEDARAGARVGKIAARMLVLNDTVAVRHFITPTTTE